MKTVLITLTSPGTSTGNFSLYSDSDSYALPFQTGISRASLITGYTSSLVPDSATVIRVQSTGTCTTYKDLTIGTAPTTTTTTTVASLCTPLIYGYDAFDPDAACSALQTDYYYDGTVLHNPGTLTSCNGTVASVGYYSDGTDEYYFDGIGPLVYLGGCPVLEQSVDVQVKLYSGTSTVSMSVGYSLGTGGVWDPWVLLNASTATSSYVSKGTIYVPDGVDCLVGIIKTSNSAFVSYRNLGDVHPYCGWDEFSSLQLISVSANTTLYLTADPAGTHYSVCLTP